jgi:diacylglycerol kinase family enzyme
MTIASELPLRFHVDGEVVDGGMSLPVSVHAAALPVKVPAAYSTKR